MHTVRWCPGGGALRWAVGSHAETGAEKQRRISFNINTDQWKNKATLLFQAESGAEKQEKIIYYQYRSIKKTKQHSGSGKIGELHHISIKNTKQQSGTVKRG
jgi:hypothetical protein